MMNLALFDLDHTLLPIDSDNEWGNFLVRTGLIDGTSYTRRNADFYEQYKAGTLDAVEYLEFVLGTLSRFPRQQLDQLHLQYMDEVIKPAILPSVLALLQQHRDAGDLVAIVTATNHFIAKPIAEALGVEHLIAAMPELDDAGNITGRIDGTPTLGAGKLTHTHAWLEKLGKKMGDFERTYFYSDSHNDIPLMSVVTHPIATNPNAALSAHASLHGWPSLHLFND